MRKSLSRLWCWTFHLRYHECFDSEYQGLYTVRYLWGCLKCCRSWETTELRSPC